MDGIKAFVRSDWFEGVQHPSHSIFAQPACTCAAGISDGAKIRLGCEYKRDGRTCFFAGDIQPELAMSAGSIGAIDNGRVSGAKSGAGYGVFGLGINAAIDMFKTVRRDSVYQTILRHMHGTFAMLRSPGALACSRRTDQNNQATVANRLIVWSLANGKIQNADDRNCP
jgi:hypothetical protein